VLEPQGFLTGSIPVPCSKRETTAFAVVFFFRRRESNQSKCGADKCSQYCQSENILIIYCIESIILLDKLEFVGEYMKNLYIVGGTMGVGKTAVCQQLKMNLSNSVLLDGDWCWDSNPFQVTDETKSMVMDNICYLLNNFLHCSAYENVIFCWVMHQQSIIDSIVEKLDTQSCDVKCISLIVDEANLRKRLTKDVESGIRVEDIIERSITRIPMYDTLNTIKIDTNEKTVAMIANEIKLL
jgi:broad-specificity NMP kinase